jgi:hypothetical protein
MQQGQIVAYSSDASAGVIKCKNGKLHYFSKTQWLSRQTELQSNLKVIFEESPDCARDVRVRED